MEKIYKKLAVHLDKNTPGSFPKTKSGVELRILKQLFTKEHARLTLSLTMFFESAHTIADKIGKNIEQVKPVLIEMGQKGLILHSTKDNKDQFMLLNFVVGIWEYQVNNLTKELIKDFNEYVPYLMKAQFSNKTKQLRTIPVAKAISTQMHVMDYENVEKIIKSQSKILVAPCICRKEHKIMGEGCDKILEACLIFSGGAYIYESRNIGRVISCDEALSIAKKAEQQGLVPQPSNSKKPINICFCCNCCCQILKNIKNFEAPAKIISSNFQAVSDKNNCTGCSACEQACPMDAISINEDNIANVDFERCIGCGLCVVGCEFNAISLQDKQQKEKIDPPSNIVETYINIAKEKGLF